MEMETTVVLGLFISLVSFTPFYRLNCNATTNLEFLEEKLFFEKQGKTEDIMAALGTH